MDCHSQPLELWRFLLTFKIYLSDYLKFNSKNILEVVKSLKCNNFPLYSIQTVIKKLIKIHCHARFFKLWWFLLTFIVNIIQILQFYNSKYSDKNQVTEKQEFSPKKDLCFTLKRPNKQVPTLFSCTVVVSISLSDENIKYSKINSKSIWLRAK